MNVGEYAVALGRSYHEIAMEGRSLHRTQSMGAARRDWTRYTSLDLVKKTSMALMTPRFSPEPRTG